MALFGQSGQEVVMVADRSGIHRAHKLASTLTHWHEQFRLYLLGIHAKRDKLPSIAYSEELISSRSATLQSADRHHGIVGQERCHFQLDS